jgi:histidyl-tRNA synthetase
MSKINLNPIKGFKDIYPEEFLQRKYITDVIRKVSNSFGYLEYDGPVLEENDLYRLKSGDSLNQETYTFKDRGGRLLTMRPEMTPTLARMLALRSTDYKKPIRWYSIPSVFRNENPQKARFRQFSQYNVDIIGDNSLLSDIEIINICVSILRNLGFEDKDFKILFNNRESVFRDLSKYTKDFDKTMSLIDHKNKITESQFESELLKLLKDKKYIESVMRYLAKEEFESIPEINDIINLGRSFDLNLIYDPTIVRGFDYYTGTVFEIWDSKNLIKRSIIGGGRYSNLISLLGGEDISGVGAGLGIEVLQSFISEYNKKININFSYDYFISTFDNIDVKFYSKIAGKLRENGDSVLLNLNNDWNLKKQLEFALKINCKNFVILGEKELKENKLLVKNLVDNKETFISLKDLSI